jgi:hypothetical protein
MAVDVRSSVVIAQPRAVVAAYASDFANLVSWRTRGGDLEWETEPPAVVGSRLAFTTTLLGRTFRCTCDVELHIPDERLVLGLTGGPFPMETSYWWRDAASGGTLMELRNRGDVGGWWRLARPALATALRRAGRQDLARLKGVLESPS